jgi:hypothetical protein
VAAELNQLNSITDRQQAMAFYKALSNDGLRVLAGLPGVERAFKQLTIQPLDPDDAANANRRGPDNPDDFVVDPNQRAYEDTLDGRTINRYFYRAAYVDGAHNLSPLGLSGPPIYLPDVVPPRAPVITKILGGDREITLRWASNREPDLAEYRVYRAESREAARDVRLMALVHTEPVPVGDPAARPAEMEWVDQSVQGLKTFYYRLAAVDEANNISKATSQEAARAFDDTRPDPPTWEPAMPGTEPDSLALSWTSPVTDLACLVQRSPTGAGDWSSISGWLERSTYTFTDSSRASGETYDYRLRVLDQQGRQNRAFGILTA